MSEDYRAIVGEIHVVNEEIKLLCRKKKALRTEDEVSRPQGWCAKGHRN